MREDVGKCIVTYVVVPEGAEHFDLTESSPSGDNRLEDIRHFLQRHTPTGARIGDRPRQARVHIVLGR